MCDYRALACAGCGLRVCHFDRLWNMGDAFHCHAGILARNADRLQHHAHRVVACFGDRSNWHWAGRRCWVWSALPVP